MNVNCGSGVSGQHACQNTNIYCPDEGVCNVECATSGACDNANIYIPNKQHEGMVLDCNPDDNDACLDTDIVCIDTGLSSVMSYDSTNSYWRCLDFNCCPFNEGNITCSEGSNCLVCKCICL